MKKIFSMLMAITMLMCAVGFAPISAQAQEYTYGDTNEFEAKYNISYYQFEGSWEANYTKIQSVDELPNTSERYAKYDEEFFNDKFLIILDVGTAAYSGDSFRVVSVIENDENLTVDIDYISTEIGLEDWIPWRIMLEADRSQLNKEIKVRIGYDYSNVDYYAGGININSETRDPQSASYIVKIDSAEQLESYVGMGKDEIIEQAKIWFSLNDYVLFVQWVEPNAGRTREVKSVYFDLLNDNGQITVKMSSFTPDEEYPTVPTQYCAVIPMSAKFRDNEVVLEDDDNTPPKRVVTVEPPNVNLESGEVPYGSKVTISSPKGNDFTYTVNGERFINSRLTQGVLTDAVITITEDTVLVVRSMIDVIEPDTEYIFPEATYTYTIGGCVVPSVYPYTINSLKLVSESGEEYDAPPTDTSFIVDVDITKNGERDSKDYFIVAVYDTNGALISMNYIKANLPTGSDFSCGVNIPKTDKTIGSIKAFVWDSPGGMGSLAESKVIDLF